MARTQRTEKTLHSLSLRQLMPKLAVLLLFNLPASPTPAQTPTQAGDDSLRTTRHTQLFGVGRTNLLDTYLSPVEYGGTSLYLLHRSERLARWGKGRVSVQGTYAGSIALPRSSADDDKAMDGSIEAAVAWHYNFPRTAAGTRLALGGMAGTTLGFTYLMRGGNNPAQGRWAADIGLSALCEQPFRVGRHTWQAAVQLDIPLLGVRFSPNYGQSYYEIFSLGHYDHNLRLTHPINAPTARLTALLNIPLWGANVCVGYGANVRQSEVNHLKYHSWNHCFLIGYVRRLRLLR